MGTSKNFLKAITKKSIIFSAIFAMVATFLCYFHNNATSLTGEDLFLYMVLQKVSEWGHVKKVNYGDAVYVNVYYDRELVPVYWADTHDPKGTTVVTDRKKLYQFLRLLRKSNQAKYIILDLGFSPEETTPYDDSLFNEIRSMDNIVFACDTAKQMPRPWLKDKAALAVYQATVANAGFTRYTYTSPDNDRYLPTKIYETLHPSKRIRKYGKEPFSFYFSGNSLCQNTCFLTFDSTKIDEYQATQEIEGKNSANATFYNLGADFITPIEDSIYTEEEMCRQIGNLTRDKYVVIANLIENDNHDTYFGTNPGCLILMRALQTLEEGGNLVSIWQLIAWTLIFFVVSLAIISFSRPHPKCARNKNPHFWSFLFSLLTFSIFLGFCNAVEYCSVEKVTSLSLPILLFAIEKLYCQFKYHKSDEN